MKKNQLVLQWFAASSTLCIICHIKNLLYMSHYNIFSKTYYLEYTNYMVHVFYLEI